MRGAIFALVFLCAAALAGILMAATGSPAARSSPCGRIAADPRSELRVVGNRMEDTAGNVVMPYGISVVGGPQTMSWARTEKSSLAQIVAARRYWHVNAVRIQVSEALLFREPTRGHSYNVPFARSVDRLVCKVLRQGDIPVVNDTTLFTGRERGPGQRTRRFWRFMSKRYGNRFPVIFDLFNEPQVTRDPRTKRFFGTTKVWRLWRSGGRVGQNNYLGMQDLVDEIRVGQRVRNVIWAEEPYYVDSHRESLEPLPRHRLEGSNIVYAFHKPNMREDSASFRGLRAAAAAGLPLVNSEWSQFAATDRPWMCQSDAYRTAPTYLEFLRRASIGLLVWSLQPGSLVRGVPGVDTVNDGKFAGFTENPYDLAEPSEMRRSYGCTRSARGQGVGRLVMDYFERHSARPAAGLFPQFGSP